MVFHITVLKCPPVTMFVFSLKIAEQKLYEHWKQNAPELREVGRTNQSE